MQLAGSKILLSRYVGTYRASLTSGMIPFCLALSVKGWIYQSTGTPEGHTLGAGCRLIVGACVCGRSSMDPPVTRQFYSMVALVDPSYFEGKRYTSTIQYS